MKVIFISLFMIISSNVFGQKLNNIHLSSGVLYANVTSKRPANEGINPFRYGGWVSLGSNLHIKKYGVFDFNLDLGLTYQERMPLEFFTFELNPQADVSSFLSILDYASHPQHEFHEISSFDRFPNFKYLHIETIPSITFGKRLKTSVGVGLFGGILINKNQVTRKPSDFGDRESHLMQRGVTGNIEYRRVDFGWQPKISCTCQITQKVNLGIEAKSYHSLVRMNDTAVSDERVFNFFWVAYAGGITLQYQFNTNKENK
jgi:hypothetical protein